MLGAVQLVDVEPAAAVEQFAGVGSAEAFVVAEKFAGVEAVVAEEAEVGHGIAALLVAA